MDAAAFRDAIEEESTTELERLGSSKLLVALTGADLEASTVLAAAADSEHTAMRTFEAWAEDDDDAREFFADLADQEREHYERVVTDLEDGHDPADGGPMHAYLRSLDATAARLGGVVGRALVSTRAHLQVVSFFVNEGDETRADRFRDLRAETDESLERALSLLEDVCGSESEDESEAEDDRERERARAAAEYVIQLAYDDYADSLGDLGLDPKPIC